MVTWRKFEGKDDRAWTDGWTITVSLPRALLSGVPSSVRWSKYSVWCDYSRLLGGVR
jgi:hypothetical protein